MSWLLLSLTLAAVACGANGQSDNYTTCAGDCTTNGFSWCDRFALGDGVTSNCVDRTALPDAICVRGGVWHTKPRGCQPLPVDFDARKEWPNCVTQINNQGTCGSCYLWSTLGSIGDRICIAAGTPIDPPINLSPQRHISCADIGGCNGGYVNAVLNGLLQSNGTAMCAPTCALECGTPGTVDACASGCSRYENATDHCPEHESESGDGCYDCPASCDNGSPFQPTSYCGITSATPSARHPFTFDDPPPITDAQQCGIVSRTNRRTGDSNCHFIAAGRMIGRFNQTREENDRAVQTELYQNGPVSAVYDFCDDFYSFFQSTPYGIYESCNCSSTGLASAAHAIKVVGWGESASGIPYWLIANSWGRDWPDPTCAEAGSTCNYRTDCGYFKMRRGISCGINGDSEHVVYAGYPTPDEQQTRKPLQPQSQTQPPPQPQMHETAAGAAIEIPIASPLATEALQFITDWLKRAGPPKRIADFVVAPQTRVASVTYQPTRHLHVGVFYRGKSEAVETVHAVLQRSVLSTAWAVHTIEHCKHEHCTSI